MADATDQMIAPARPLSMEAAAGGLLSALERLGAAYAQGRACPSERAAAWEQAQEAAAQARAAGIVPALNDAQRRSQARVERVKTAIARGVRSGRQASANSGFPRRRKIST